MKLARRAVAVVLCCLMLGCPMLGSTVARAEAVSVREAKEHLRRGVKLFERGEIEPAIVELEAAHRLDPTAASCYALGQAYREKGNCTLAIDYYRCAVARAPTEGFARAASYQIGRCVVDGGRPSEPPGARPAEPPGADRGLSALPAAPPTANEKVGKVEVVEKVESVEPRVVPEVRLDQRPARRRYIAPSIVAGAAVLMAAIGAGLVGSVSGDLADVERRWTILPTPDLQREAGALEVRAYAGYAMWGVAGALAIVDVGLWVVAARRRRNPR